MQISYEGLYFQASNRPQHSFKRLHEGLKLVRSAYGSHISRPQPHGLKTAATSLLRSYNQHSVQQVPVGQNGSRYPLGGRSPARGKGEVKPPNTVQHATRGSADIVKLLNIGFN